MRCLKKILKIVYKVTLILTLKFFVAQINLRFGFKRISYVSLKYLLSILSSMEYLHVLRIIPNNEFFDISFTVQIPTFVPTKDKMLKCGKRSLEHRRGINMYHTSVLIPCVQFHTLIYLYSHTLGLNLHSYINLLYIHCYQTSVNKNIKF